MLSLKYKFISNNKDIINGNFNYFTKDNKIKFMANKENYEYDSTNNILTKKDSDKILAMNFKEKVIKITLIANNITIDYPINVTVFNTTSNSLEVEYILSEENITNYILIEY